MQVEAAATVRTFSGHDEGARVQVLPGVTRLTSRRLDPAGLEPLMRTMGCDATQVLGYLRGGHEVIVGHSSAPLRPSAGHRKDPHPKTSPRALASLPRLA